MNVWHNVVKQKDTLWLKQQKQIMIILHDILGVNLFTDL
jgi:hypothetical protein